MVDKLLLKLFGWIDNKFKKVEELWTFDFCNCKNKKKKK